MKKLNKKNFPVGIAAFILAVILLVGSPNANATRLVYPDDPYWGAHTMSNGEVAITPTNPRNGNGSLELTITGPKQYGDWAFYTRYADDVKRDIWAPNSDITTSWGLLSDINKIAFDWYRETAIIEELAPWDPWNYQSPVLRLLINDNNVLSELVWEIFYTDITWYRDTYEGLSIPIQEWVIEDLKEQYFWKHIFNEGYVLDNNTVGEPFVDPDITLQALSISNWTSSNKYYSNEAYVYGLSVGVGSAWPYEYLGYVDNVYLSFNKTGTVIDDNFEFPVPEPSTLLLLLSGMATLSVGRRFCGKLCQA